LYRLTVGIFGLCFLSSFLRQKRMGWSRTSITVNPSGGPITTLPLGEGFVYSSPLTLIAMLSGTLIKYP
jgi:hypothetical protein